MANVLSKTAERPLPVLPPVAKATAPQQKWKEALEAGFQVLPDVLLKNQQQLGLTAIDVVVLINLTMSWWTETQLPFPRPTTIAKRMGINVRTVQRSLERMESMGMIERVRLHLDESSPTAAFDLSGLVRYLQHYAVAEIANRKEAAAAKKLRLSMERL
jgi:DNA replication protein DnaD